MRISDWSSDVCSSDLELADLAGLGDQPAVVAHPVGEEVRQVAVPHDPVVIGHGVTDRLRPGGVPVHPLGHIGDAVLVLHVERSDPTRSEEHTSELQSLMRISYAVFCLKKKKRQRNQQRKSKYTPQTQVRLKQRRDNTW